MSKKLWFALSAVVVGAMLVLSGCGGGGSSSNEPVTDPNLTSISSGIAVDPYIVGAVFQELDAEGNLIQESGLSNEKGVFTFPGALRRGSIIAIKATEKGLHNGVPFQGTLKRKVDAAGGELVASPITTLLADGMEPSEVITLLKSTDLEGALDEVTEADLTANPMAGMEKDQILESDRALVAATISINAAIVLNNGKIDKTNLEETLPVLANKVKTVFSESASADISSVLSAAVAVSDFIVEKTKADTSDDPVTTKISNTSDLITSEVIQKTVEAAESGNVSIEEKGSVLAPVTNTATVRGYLDKAFADLQNFDSTGSSRSLVNAVDYFKLASATTGTDTSASAQDKDAAHFFGGLARVAALSNPFSDATDNGLNNLGDILDAFGAPEDRSILGNITLEECVDAVDESGNIITNPYDGSAYQICDIELTKGTPTTGDLQKFLYNNLATELKAAILQLEKVSQNFNNTEWADPAGETATEFDYSDALFFKGLAQSMLAQVLIQQAYDVNVDLYEEQVASESGNETTQSFLAANPNLGRLLEKAKLAEAKTFISGSIDDLTAAINAVKDETDTDQKNDFLSFYTESCTMDDISYEYTCSEDRAQMAVDIQDTLDDLALAKKALASQITVADNGTTDTSDDRVVDFRQFFNGIDIRNQMPAFTGDAPGFFPDPTLGGLLVQGFDMNRDWDGDGSPDEFVGYTRFSEKILTPMPIRGGINDYSSSDWFEIVLNSDRSFSLSEYDYSTSSQISYRGAWSVKDGALVLESSDSQHFPATLILSEGDGDGDYFWAEGGATFTGANADQWNFYLYEYLN